MLGRPILEPRVTAVERQLQAQYHMIQALEIAVLELTERIQQGVPTVSGQYTQQFTKWPKNGSP